MDHAYKTEFTIYFLNSPQIESFKIHIPLYISKDTFHLNTTPFSQKNALL